MSIAYCDGQRLKRLFLAGSKHVFSHRDELDRINVFPVPDGDTGTNLALTFRAMAAAVAESQDKSIDGVAGRLAEAGVVGARGNSGMMLAHFFLGFAEGLAGRDRADAGDLAAAMRRASDSLYRAVDRPVEGTILTVVRESTEEVERRWRRTPDLEELARHLLGAARESLERTPALLPALREANVVDAGGKGFVRFVEGIVALIDGNGAGQPPAVAPGSSVPAAAAAAQFPRDVDRAFRYCTELLIRGSPPPQRALAEAISDMGGSLIVNRAPTVAKIHIHTDEPARVEAALTALGCDVEQVKADDMTAQHRRLRQAARRRVALVTDATCDLPPEMIIEHDIVVVPLTVMLGDRAYRDQVEISHEELIEWLRDPRQPLPTTSQPAPASIEEAYSNAAEHADQVLGIFLSGALSGTVGQARKVAERFDGATVTVVDSRTVSLGLGFQVLRAAELIGAGWEVSAVLAELARIRGRAGVYLTVDTLSYLRRSGRVGKARAFLGNLLDVKPVLSVDEEGVVVPVDRVRGREALLPRVLELLRARIPAERSRLRVGVVHVDCLEVAERLAIALQREFEPEETLIRPAAGVIATHTGPGAWGVLYQAE